VPSAAELSGLRPQSLRIPSHDGVMLNVGYFGGCGRPVLFTHYVAIGAQIVEQPIEGIIIFADVDLQPKETEIDFWAIPSCRRLNGARDERVRRGPLHRDTKDF